MPKSVKAPDKVLGGSKASLKATADFMAQVAAGKIITAESDEETEKEAETEAT